MPVTKKGRSKKTSLNGNQWLKNASRSVGSTSLNMFKDMVPTTYNVGSQSFQELNDARTTLANFKTEGFSEDSIINDLKNGVSNALSDLKSGNFNNKEREMEAMGFDMNFDDMLSDDFMFDNGGGDSGGTSFAGAPTAESTEILANAIVNSASAQYAVGKMNATISHHNGKMIAEGLSAINDNIGKLVQFNTNNMNNLIVSSIKYHEESIELMRGMNSNQGKREGDNYRGRSDVDNFMGYGAPDMSLYKNIIKKNFGEYVDSNMILSMFKGDGGINPTKMFAANPVGTILQFSLSAAIPAMLKKSLDSFDKSLEIGMSSILTKISDLASDDNILKSTFGQLFGIRTGYTTAFDMSHIDLKEVSAWTKKEARSLNEVIPGYLKEIAQALTGGEAKVFDHNKGYFRSEKAVVGEFKLDRRRAQVREYDDDIERIIKSMQKAGALGTADSAERFTRKMEDFVIGMGRHGKVLNIHDGSKDFNEIGKQANMSPAEIKALQNMIKKMPKRDQVNFFGGKMARSNIHQNRVFEDYMDDPNIGILVQALSSDSKKATMMEKYKSSGAKMKYSDFVKEQEKEDARRARSMTGASSGIRPDKSLEFSALEYLKSIDGTLRDGITVFIGNKGRKGGKRGKGKGPKGPQSGGSSNDEGPTATSTISDDFDLGSLEYLLPEDEYKENFGDRLINKNKGAGGFKGFVANIMNKPTEIMEKAVERFDDALYSIMFGSQTNDGTGKTKTFFESFGEEITKFWDNTSEWLNTKIFEPMREKLFGEEGLFNQVKQSDPYQWAAKQMNQVKENLLGEKDAETGTRSGGVLSETANELKDMVSSAGYYFTGKEYTDSKGNKHADNPNSVFGETSKIFNEFKDGLKAKIFGEDSLKGDAGGKGFVQSALDGLGEGFSAFSDAIFGPKEFENGKENAKRASMESFSDAIKTKLPKGLAFGVVGGGAGLLSGGSMGMLGSLFLPGGPIGGMLVGTAVGLASQSDSFMNFVFGEKDQDENRVGGLVSASMQKFVKDNKAAVFGGASLGAIKSLIFGNGLLTSMFLPGGIVGGAVTGIATGLLYKSKTVQDFLFGKEQPDGTKIGGVFNTISKHFPPLDGMPGMNKDTLKTVAAGTISGAALSTVVGQMGMVGAMATMGGSPILGALVGAASGIALSSDKWTKALFGEIDEETGDRKGGLLTTVTNWMNVNLAQPLAQKISEYRLDMEDWFGRAIAEPFMEAVDPVMAEIKFRIIDTFDRVKDIVGTIAGKIGGFAKDNIADPMVDAFKTKVVDPIGKAMNNMIKGMGAIAGGVISAPFKLLGLATGRLEKNHEKRGLSKMKDDQWSKFKDGEQGFAKSIYNMYGNRGMRNEARTSADGAYYNDGNTREEMIAQRKAERKQRRDDKRAKIKESREQLKMRQEYALQMGYDNFDAKGKNKKFAYGGHVKFERGEDGFVQATNLRPKEDTAKAMASMDSNIESIAKIIEPTNKEQTDELKGIKSVANSILAAISGGVGAAKGAVSGASGRASASLTGLGTSAKNAKTNLTDTFNSAKEKVSNVSLSGMVDGAKSAIGKIKGNTPGSPMDTGGTNATFKKKGITSPLSPEDKEEKSKDFLTSVMDDVQDANREEAKLEDDIEARDEDVKKKNVSFVVEQREKMEAELAEKSWKDEMLGTTRGILGALTGGDGETSNFDKILAAIMAALAALGTLLGGSDGLGGPGWLGENAAARTYGDEYIENGNYRERIIKDMVLKPLSKAVSSEVGQKLLKSLGKTGAKAGASIMESMNKYIAKHGVEGAANSGKLLANALSESGSKVLFGEVVDAIPEERLMLEMSEYMTEKINKELLTESSQKLITSGIPAIYDPAEMINEVLGEGFEKGAKNAFGDAAKAGIKSSMSEIIDVEWVEVSAKEVTEKGLKEVSDNALDKTLAKFIKSTGGAIEAFFKNSTVIKRMGNSAAAEASREVSGYVTKTLSSAGSVAKKYMPKISKAIGEAAVSMGLTVSTGGLVDLAFGAWDGLTGMAEAANLFKVSNEDIDWRMRIVSGIMKLLFGLSFIGVLIDVAAEIIEDFTGLGFKTSVAEIIYSAMASEEDEEALDQAQAAFEADFATWKSENPDRENISLVAYNDEVNRTVFQRFIADPWENFWEDPVGSTVDAAVDITTIVGGSAHVVKYGPKAVVEKSLKPITDSRIFGKIDEFIRVLTKAITTFFQNSEIAKKVGATKAGEAAGKVTNMLIDAVTKLKNSPNLLQKFFPRVTQAITESVVSMGITAASAGLVDLGFAVWDGLTGMNEAANLFKVAGDDVDITMSLVSGVVKLMFGLGFIGPLVDVASEIFEDLTGIGFKTSVAEVLYDVLSPKENEQALDQAQAAFEAEWQAYVAESGDDVTLAEYNDMQNRTIFQKYISDPFKEHVMAPFKEHVLDPMGDLWDKGVGKAKEGLSWVGDKVKQGWDSLVDGVQMGVSWMWEESPISAFNSDAVKETLGMEDEETVQLQDRIGVFVEKNPITQLGLKVGELFGLDIGEEGDIAGGISGGITSVIDKSKELIGNFGKSVEKGIGSAVDWVTTKSPLAAFNDDHIDSMMGENFDGEIDWKHRVGAGLGNIVGDIGKMFGLENLDTADEGAQAVAGTLMLIEDEAKEAWGKVKEKTSTFFGELKNGIDKGLEKTNDKVGAWLGYTNDETGAPLSFTEGMSQNLSNIKTWGQDVWADTKEWVNNGVTKTKNWFANAESNIPSALENVNKNLGKWLGMTDDSGNPLTMTEGVSFGWGNLKTWGNTMWENTKTWWNSTIDKTKSNMDTLGGNIKTSLKPMDDMLGKLLGFNDPETGEQLSLSDGVSRSYNEARSILKEGMDSINEYLESIKDKAGEIRDDITSNIKNAVKQFDKMIGSFLGFKDSNGNPMSLSEIGKATWDALMDIPKTIGDAFNTMVDNVVSTLDSWVGDVVQKGKEFFGFGGGSSRSGGYGLGSFSEFLDPRVTINNYDNSRHYNSNSSSNNYGTGSSKGFKRTPYAENNFSYYSQKDSRWGGNKYSYSGGPQDATFSDRGCGPTAMAMVATQLTGKPITPNVAGDFAQSRGFNKESGTHWDFIPAASHEYGINAKGLPTTSSYIRSELQSGRPVILSGQSQMGQMSGSPYTPSGHYVVASGYKNGMVQIQDPIGMIGNGYYDINSVAGDANVAWSFAPGRDGYSNIGDLPSSTQSLSASTFYGLGKSAGQKVLDQAKTQAGKPYQYGGNLPPIGNSSSTDCSGLCQYAYTVALGESWRNKFGSRWTCNTMYGKRNDRNVVKKVINNKSDLQKGDLVLCNWKGGRYAHVVLWDGDNKYFHSGNSGIGSGDYYVNGGGQWLGLRILDDEGSGNNTGDSSSSSSSSTTGSVTDPYVPFENDPLGELGARIGEVYNNYAVSALTGKEYKEIDWTKAPGVSGMVQSMIPGGSSSSGSDGGNFGSDNAGLLLENFHNLSGIFEVGGQDPKNIVNFNKLSGTVSNTAGDHGGKSYGLPQFSKNMGSLKSFVNWLRGAHPDLYAPLSKHSLASSGFDSAWRSLASEKFKLAQWEYSDKNYFDKGLSVAKSKGTANTDMITIKSIINSAVKQRGSGGSFPGVMSKGKSSNPKTAVSSMYDYMINNVNSHFRSSSASVRNGVRNRFKKEKGFALSMIDRESGGNGGFGLGGSQTPFGCGMDNLLEPIIGRSTDSTPINFKSNMNFGTGPVRSKVYGRGSTNTPIKISTPAQMRVTDSPETKSIINSANSNNLPEVLIERAIQYLAAIASNTGQTVQGLSNLNVGGSGNGKAVVQNTVVQNNPAKNAASNKKMDKSKSRMNKAMSIAAGRF